MSRTLLETSQVSVRFGGLWAVRHMDLQVAEGEIVGIIGPNGAGKSTLLNVLSGLQRPTEGSLLVAGRVNPPPWKMASLGVARSFQTVRLLKGSSVMDNVLVGGHIHSDRKMHRILLRLPGWIRAEQDLRNRVEEILRFVGLSGKEKIVVDQLSLHERRRVEIARALMVRPKVLLLDEPTAGFNQKESLDLTDLVLRIKEEGISVVLVEHNMKVVMSVADRVVVMDNGSKLTEGDPREVVRDERVIQAYLGGASGA